MPSETSPENLIIVPRCCFCSLPESQLKAKLKRCRGCSATVYCSKECQKQAWPSHKVSCRAKWNEYLGSQAPAPHDINAPIPSDSVAALDDALLVWIGIHQYEFMVIATATMCLQGGQALHFSPDSSQAIRFAIHRDPLPKFVASLLGGTRDDNPAEGFHLNNALSVSKDKFLEDCNPPDTEGALGWEGAVTSCRDVTANLPSKNGEDPELLRVGALPGIFGIKHSPILHIQPILVFRQPHDRSDTLDEETRAVFEDIRALCVAIMDAGLVLRPHSVERVNLSSCPNVGALVRRKKKHWEWERIPDWDWGRAALMVPRELRKTDLHPKELWTRFFSQSAWTAQQVIPKTTSGSTTDSGATLLSNAGGANGASRAAQAGWCAGALVATFAALVGALVL